MGGRVSGLVRVLLAFAVLAGPSPAWATNVFRPADSSWLFTDTSSLQAGSNTLMSGSTSNTIDSGCWGCAILSGGNSSSGGSCTGSCRNEISNAGADISIITGGYDNVLGSTNAAVASFIGGGGHNTIDGDGGHIVIVGGSTNSISGTTVGYGFIGAGSSNSISGNYGVIVGGGTNSQAAGSDYSFIGGGNTNVVSANVDYGIIPGGQDNTVSKNYATAIGRKVASRYYGGVSQASGQILSQGDAQSSVVVSRKQTMDGTANVELFADGAGERLTIPGDAAIAFRVMIVARQTNADNNAAYEFVGLCSNQAGTTGIVGSITKTVIAETAGIAATWDADVTCLDATADAVLVRVTGGAATTINWVSRAELTEVTG